MAFTFAPSVGGSGSGASSGGTGSGSPNLSFGNGGGPRVTYSVKEDPAVEKIVRPFETPAGWPVPRRLPPEQDTGDALIDWKANINVVVTTLEAQGLDPNQLDPQTPAESFGSEATVTEEKKTNVWTETSRITSTVRVTNPDNPTNYVDVERIERVNFNGPSGNVTYVFRNGGTPLGGLVTYI
jgi:hypothetical protein